jgi:uncharacterized protein YcaQ
VETLQLTRIEAQALAVIAQRLDRRPFRRRPTAADILDTFRHLGTIQLDTISVISRSHETVLWSRLGPYDPDLVTELYTPGNALTEYLGHAASIMPTEFLPIFRPYMEKARNAAGGWSAQPEGQAIMRAVVDRVTAEGPMSSRDFDAPPDASRAGLWEWWGNKPERRALSTLWIRGDLMIHKRDRGFARYFDLPERVAPGFWEGDAISVECQQREFLRHAVRALGVITARWASDYFRTGGPTHVPAATTRALLQQFAEEGSIVPISVPDIDEPMWMDVSLMERLELLRERKGRPTLTTLLSPFDNLIWNRFRGEQLWDFYYRLECYVPAPKRQYGYYTLPILHRGRIVGRLDPSYNRKTGVLTIKALHLEPWVRPGDALMRSITGAIEDLLAFLGGAPGAWVVTGEVPPDVAMMLRPYAGEVRSIVV